MSGDIDEIDGCKILCSACVTKDCLPIEEDEVDDDDIRERSEYSDIIFGIKGDQRARNTNILQIILERQQACEITSPLENESRTEQNLDRFETTSEAGSYSAYHINLDEDEEDDDNDDDSSIQTFALVNQTSSTLGTDDKSSTLEVLPVVGNGPSPLDVNQQKMGNWLW